MTDDDLKDQAGRSAATTWVILSILLTIVIYDWHYLFTFKAIVLIVIGMFFAALTIGIAKYLLARTITNLVIKKKWAPYLLSLFTLILTIFEWGMAYILINNLLEWLFR